MEIPAPVVVRRSKTDRVLGGVAGGLGRYLGVDPVLIRIALVVLLLAGAGLFLYLIAWILIPEETESDNVGPSGRRSGPEATRLVIGVLLIAVGGMMLIDRLVPSWWINNLVWPSVLIAVGLAVIVSGAKR